MMNALFGTKNMTTSDQLRSVGRRKVNIVDVDSWSLDEVDALRVPILSGPQLAYSSNSKNRWNADRVRQIGIYSPSREYCGQLTKQMTAYGVGVQCFGYDEAHSQMNFHDLNAIDMWLVNITDDDESEVLDRVMNICTNTASLFLSETVLSKQCGKKADDFIKENLLVNKAG